ncbi:hypothetical protein NNX28_16940 [Arthrobacter sp. zg-Y859]|uniref:Uncharacterized protein n=1 Tax=Arthrobacter jinronghuae TaxID=2964609 RepID=A0ABT1NV49_9MICC|nr:hypothetical protein [Arthrobacter jinronghuae]MCQ1951606.1 hypothetical protein [Arthrobacter jinronghuae]UWX79680.1 hypothetical protein N2K98_05640 [Arthrobacter jinronghuae]
MRLYRAVCAWLEAHAAQMGHQEDQEPQPEGNNFTQLEHAHSYTSEPELHAGYRDQPEYYEDRRGRIGFQPR